MLFKAAGVVGGGEDIAAGGADEAHHGIKGDALTLLSPVQSLITNQPKYHMLWTYTQSRFVLVK